MTQHSLAKHPLFRSLDAAALRIVEAACIWRQAAPQVWIVDREAPGTDVFFVLQGHVRVVVATAGRDAILRDIKEGEFFGELAAIDEQPRAAGILAVTNCLLASMPAAAFRRAIHAHPDVCDQVMLALVARIRTLAQRLNEQSGLTMKHRLLAELLRLSRVPISQGDMPPGGRVVSPPPTHAELAARIASHREAVTRELSALEKAGLIGRRRGAISLPEPARLQALIDEAGER
jgi:CRP-like cAMP-binding protein